VFFCARGEGPLYHLMMMYRRVHQTHLRHLHLSNSNSHSHTLIHTHSHAFTRTHTHSHTLTHTHTHSHTLTRTHTHSHTHTIPYLFQILSMLKVCISTCGHHLSIFLQTLFLFAIQLQQQKNVQFDVMKRE
jgi:hypothetical protein